jgi:hypothetical protein
MRVVGVNIMEQGLDMGPGTTSDGRDAGNGQSQSEVAVMEYQTWSVNSINMEIERHLYSHALA